MIKVATWNWCQGRAYPEWCKRRTDADLWFLQEAKAFSGMGDETVLHAAVPRNGWGSAIVSRLGPVTPVEIPNYAGWVTGGVIARPNGPIAAFSIHSPSKNGDIPWTSYVEECRRIVTVIRDAIPINALLVIGGDFSDVCTKPSVPFPRPSVAVRGNQFTGTRPTPATP